MTINELSQLVHSIPRYTSYPPSTYWESVCASHHLRAIQKLEEKDLPLSVYIHIPFCQKRCLFCGCFVIASKNVDVQKAYVTALKKEISLFAKKLRAQVIQLHFGGGTPTTLSPDLMKSLVDHLFSCFDFEKEIEMAIEVDPRTINNKEDLLFLRRLGFNRISLGVQDLDPKVQAAIGRIHTKEKITTVYKWARESGFQGINIDLIYGLPYQTIDSFAQTIEDLLALSPDRIVLFSFAYVPNLKPHQQALDLSASPSLLEKQKIFDLARIKLIDAGYLAIGIDHFVKPQDTLANAYANQTMTRNFQGYDLGLSSTLIAFGISAISQFKEGFFQNVKDLNTYLSLLEKEIMPVCHGKILTEDDQIRGWVIRQIMCGYGIDKQIFYQKFRLIFDDYFAKELKHLHEHIPSILFIDDASKLYPTKEGMFFVRNLAHIFDFYTNSRV